MKVASLLSHDHRSCRLSPFSIPSIRARVRVGVRGRVGVIVRVRVRIRVRVRVPNLLILKFFFLFFEALNMNTISN